jgi:hypothetical protein
VTTGQLVGWTYEVTNTGESILADVLVTDDAIADDAATIDCEGNGNVIEDLEPGETAICTAFGDPALGQYTNLGTAEVTIGAYTFFTTDRSHYLGIASP